MDKSNQSEHSIHGTAREFFDAAWRLYGHESLQSEWDEMIEEWEQNPCSPAELCNRVLGRLDQSSPCWFFALAVGFLFTAGDQ